MGIESALCLTAFEGELINGGLSSVEVEFDVVENLILFKLCVLVTARGHTPTALLPTI
jgi:hypothetical protein